jgi:hypothetical protein
VYSFLAIGGEILFYGRIGTSSREGCRYSARDRLHLRMLRIDRMTVKQTPIGGYTCRSSFVQGSHHSLPSVRQRLSNYAYSVVQQCYQLSWCKRRSLHSCQVLTGTLSSRNLRPERSIPLDPSLRYIFLTYGQTGPAHEAACGAAVVDVLENGERKILPSYVRRR